MSALPVGAIERAASVIEHSPQSPAVINEGQALLAMIERAASNPTMDMDKLERLIAMRERIDAREAERAFDAAMSAAQAELSPVAADANNPQTKSRYATYAALDRACRPTYTKHGFSLSFDTGHDAPADHLRVLCYVAHREGHKRTHHVDMPADGKGAKGGDVMTKTHATGAAMSYGQRYLLKLIFNMAVGDDKDGNEPSAPADLLNEHEIGEVTALMDEVGADRTKFLNFLKVEGLHQIKRRDLPKVIAALEAKRRVAK